MAVYQLRTYADIIAAVREEIGIQSTDTTFINRIKRDINTVHQEVQAETKWWWCRGETSVQMPAFYDTGTAALTEDSATVTLTDAPAYSLKGWKFSNDAFNEIYTVESHTAGSVTVNLADLYSDDTNATASFKFWRDRLPLPTDCKDVINVWHQHQSEPLEPKGLKEFRQIVAANPRAEGKPQYYFTGDFFDPSPTSAITSLPAPSTRSSAGTIKTVVFASALPAATVASYTAGEPLRWHISGAGEPSYNGDIFVSTVGTTSVANDTITYTGKAELTENSTADSTMTITQLDTEADYDRYRELNIYPFLNDTRVLLQVDYIKELAPLSNDNDEPALPLQDRRVLLYGALAAAWDRFGDSEKADKNEGKYRNALAKLAGKLQDSFDKPKLVPSRLYLASKRRMTNLPSSD